MQSIIQKYMENSYYKTLSMDFKQLLGAGDWVSS